MIDTDLREHLIELSTGAGNRVFTGNADQLERKPLVVIRRASGEQALTLGGAKLFQRGQFDINVLTDDYPAAYPTANAIRDALHGFRGLLGGTGGTTVQSCRCVSFPSDQSEVDGDRVTRWVQATYLFVYSEA
jgi:hypothetical protein